MDLSTHQLIERMQRQAERRHAHRDARSDFLRCYSMMTHSMRQGLASGRFEDAAWVERLMHRFAAYYFEALELYERRHPDTPAVWKQVHDAAGELDLNVLYLLLMGMNAHINYDLALALYDGLHQEWPSLSEEVRQMRERDHQMVNRIIGETIDLVQSEVVNPQSKRFALVDKLMGRMDEWLLSQLITGRRASVWDDAQDFLKAGNAGQRAAIRLRLEAAVLVRGNEIASLF